MALRPLNDNLIVLRDADEYVSDYPEVRKALKDGIIVLPDSFEGFFKKAPMSGIVFSWGNRCKYSYEPGDRVFFGRFSGVKLNWEECEYYFINEKDILAKEET